jgi:hypothetical protein
VFRFQRVDWRVSCFLGLLFVAVWLNLQRLSERRILITGRLSDHHNGAFPDVQYQFDVRLGQQQLRWSESGDCSALVASLKHYSVWIPRPKFPARVSVLRRPNGEFAAEITLRSSREPSQVRVCYQFGNQVSRLSGWMRLVPGSSLNNEYCADAPHLTLKSVPRNYSPMVPFRRGGKRLLPNLLFAEGKALAQMIHESDEGAGETSELPPSFEDERRRLLRDLRNYSHQFSSTELDDHLEALRRLELVGAADAKSRAWSEVLASMAKQKAVLGEVLGGQRNPQGALEDPPSGARED